MDLEVEAHDLEVFWLETCMDSVLEAHDLEVFLAGKARGFGAGSS